MLTPEEKVLAYRLSDFKEALRNYLKVKEHTLSGKSLKVYWEKLEHLRDFLRREQNYSLDFDLKRAVQLENKKKLIKVGDAIPIDLDNVL